MKKDKQKTVLLGVVELYIKTGKPIGSNTLKENGFEHLSSATIRNYFGKLEKLGFLKQPHSSGGRIPTTLAYREYVNSIRNLKTSDKDKKILEKELKCECKKLTSYLHNAADLLSNLCNGCVFLISPSFDQDFIQNIKILKIEEHKLLFVILTDFGQIKTEALKIEENIFENDLKLIEDFFLWRLSKKETPNIKNPKLLKLSQRLYNEIMLRYAAKYSHAKEDESYKSGFSKLLSYQEFQDPVVLANSLALFEDFNKIKTLLTECMKINQLTLWIGDELAAFGSLATDCSVIAIPYHINVMPVGALALLIPKKANYKKLFGIMKVFSKKISEALTKSIYKFKIDFQPPTKQTFKQSIMLEDKRKF
jgi:heat-inducible transcriptional repressor